MYSRGGLIRILFDLPSISILAFVCYYNFMKKNQNGFGHIALFMFIVVLLVVGFAGWKVMNANKDKSKNGQGNQQNSNNSDVQKGSGPNYSALAACTGGAVFN